MVTAMIRTLVSTLVALVRAVLMPRTVLALENAPCAGNSPSIDERKNEFVCDPKIASSGLPSGGSARNGLAS